MTQTLDSAAVLDRWDNGAIAAELTDDQTIAQIAKDLKAREDAVRAILVANGRIGA